MTAEPHGSAVILFEQAAHYLFFTFILIFMRNRMSNE